MIYHIEVMFPNFHLDSINVYHQSLHLLKNLLSLRHRIMYIILARRMVCNRFRPFRGRRRRDSSDLIQPTRYGWSCETFKEDSIEICSLDLSVLL